MDTIKREKEYARMYKAAVRKWIRLGKTKKQWKTLLRRGWTVEMIVEDLME